MRLSERIIVDPVRVEAARAGDDAAVETLLRAAWPHAYRIALSILRDPAGAEDAAQNACAVMLHALPRLRAAEAFGAWVYRIVVREAFAVGRWLPQHEPLVADALASSTSLTDAEVRVDVLSALGKLSPNERAAIALHYYADLKSADIAEILEMPDSTVRYHLMHARRKLEALLDGHRPAYSLPGALHAAD